MHNNSMAENTEAAQQYRTLLVQTWQKTQDDIDKAILSPSAGALAVSFVFLKDIIGPAGAHKPGFLFSAWVCWAISSALTLLSFLTSRWAFGSMIKTVDDEIAGRLPDLEALAKLRRLSRAKAWCFNPARLNFCTSAFNWSAAVLVILGIVLMIIFTGYNLEALSYVRPK
jgi:hypothetical protein